MAEFGTFSLKDAIAPALQVQQMQLQQAETQGVLAKLARDEQARNQTQAIMQQFAGRPDEAADALLAAGYVDAAKSVVDIGNQKSKKAGDAFDRWNSALTTMSSMLGKVSEAADPDLAYSLVRPGMLGLFERLNPGQDVSTLLPEKFDAAALSSASTEVEKIAKALGRARKSGDAELAGVLEQRLGALTQGRETPGEAAAKAAAVKKAEMGVLQEGGAFAGQGMDAQYWNAINNGDPASPEYASAYFELFTRPRFVQTDEGFVPIQTSPPPNVRPPGVATAGRPPATASGGAPVPGAPAATAGPVVAGTEKPPSYTQEQNNAYTYSERIQASNRIIDQLVEQGFEPGLGMRARENLAGSYGVRPQEQQFLQAERDLITAILRKESGATISDNEFETARRQYIPQRGDSPEVLRQKADARRRAFETMRSSAGTGRTGASPGGGSGVGQQFTNPSTGEVIEWNGTAYVPVN